MRIIVVHNYYGSSAPSGENIAVDAEIAMLRRAGHDVHAFIRRSDEIREEGWRGTVRGGIAVTWNSLELIRFRKFLRATKPDIVHVHNTFPLISPAIFWVAKEFAASVLTLHNYRLFCASALLLRNGNVCTRCLDEHSVLPALRHGCYRNSRIATLPLVQSIALHKRIGTWERKVDAFIAVTKFQADRLIAAGLPADKTYVKPNFFSGTLKFVPWNERQDFCLFAGRLMPEKGVAYLIEAWHKLGSKAPRLKIMGDGPLRASLEELARKGGDSRIEFIGAVNRDQSIREISQARLLIMPSVWFEGFPIVLQEAFAAGTPCAVSDIGSLPTIVGHRRNGLLFAPRSGDSISTMIEQVWDDDALLKQLSATARASYELCYTEETNIRLLEEIYALAMAQRRSEVA